MYFHSSCLISIFCVDFDIPVLVPRYQLLAEIMVCVLQISAACVFQANRQRASWNAVVLKVPGQDQVRRSAVNLASSHRTIKASAHPITASSFVFVAVAPWRPLQELDTSWPPGRPSPLAFFVVDSSVAFPSTLVLFRVERKVTCFLFSTKGEEHGAAACTPLPMMVMIIN